MFSLNIHSCLCRFVCTSISTKAEEGEKKKVRLNKFNVHNILSDNTMHLNGKLNQPMYFFHIYFTVHILEESRSLDILNYKSKSCYTINEITTTNILSL